MHVGIINISKNICMIVMWEWDWMRPFWEIVRCNTKKHFKRGKIDTISLRVNYQLLSDLLGVIRVGYSPFLRSHYCILKGMRISSGTVPKIKIPTSYHEHQEYISYICQYLRYKNLCKLQSFIHQNFTRFTYL